MIFQGIRTNIAREPYIFVIFQGAPYPRPPGPAHASKDRVNKVPSKTAADDFCDLFFLTLFIFLRFTFKYLPLFCILKQLKMSSVQTFVGALRVNIYINHVFLKVLKFQISHVAPVNKFENTVHVLREKAEFYSKTFIKRPLSKRPKIDFQDLLSLNAGQMYCGMLQGVLQYFRPSFSYHLSLRSILSGRFTQVLL